MATPWTPTPSASCSRRSRPRPARSTTTRSFRHCTAAPGRPSRVSCDGTPTVRHRRATCSCSGSAARSILSTRRPWRPGSRSSPRRPGAADRRRGRGEMRTVLQAAIIGLSAGSVYALMASGLTLVFGVMRVVNVAQGALVILGAYLSYSLFSRFHLDPFLAILLVAPMLFAFVRRLRRDEQELSLLVMFAVAVGIEGALTLVYKTTYRSINPGYANRVLELAGFKVPLVRVLAFAFSVVVLSAQKNVLQRTRFGRALRATVQNPTAARLLGVEAERVAALGFGLGASTGAAAGAVYGIVFPFNPGSHYDLISRLLSIVVLGGLGSLGGSVVAALLMGVAEAVVAATLSPVWSSFAFFAVLLGVLLVRPQGMFGTVQRGGL